MVEGDMPHLPLITAIPIEPQKFTEVGFCDTVELLPMSPRASSVLTLEHVLLALLDPKPMHGYELYQELCKLQGIGRIWNITQSMLYAMLDKLEAKGYLSSQLVPGESYPPRKYMQLTELGRRSVQVWIKTPVRRAREIRQEFLAKLIIARQYGTIEALELIHNQLQDCMDWKKELLSSPLSKAPEQIDDWLVYSFRVRRVDGILEWLKDCEQEIRQQLDQG
jgi:PadR family transcriptional regulator, regulatory protein AphA